MKILPPFVTKYPELEPLFQKVDHVDIKTVEGEQTLREFISAMMSYQPKWVTFLYGVRAVFVRFLGMRQGGIPRARTYRPEDISFTPGHPAAFFKVHTAKEDCYWEVEIDDSHLKAGLMVVVEPLQNNLKKFNVITLVYYNKWTGPLYFNVIRPFHHIVVGQMAKAGVEMGDRG